jgi:hypothetical protein
MDLRIGEAISNFIRCRWWCQEFGQAQVSLKNKTCLIKDLYPEFAVLVIQSKSFVVAFFGCMEISKAFIVVRFNFVVGRDLNYLFCKTRCKLNRIRKRVHGLNRVVIIVVNFRQIVLVDDHNLNY